MNSERKAFEEYFKTTEFYKNMVKSLSDHDFNCKPLDKIGKKYISIYVQLAFEAWQASAQRQGYKLLPMEMSWQKADDLASKEWDKNKSMFCADNRDMTALQVEEFRLRWCRNKAHQIIGEYKAMIGEVDE